MCFNAVPMNYTQTCLCLFYFGLVEQWHWHHLNLFQSQYGFCSLHLHHVFANHSFQLAVKPLGLPKTQFKQKSVFRGWKSIAKYNCWYFCCWNDCKNLLAGCEGPNMLLYSYIPSSNLSPSSENFTMRSFFSENVPLLNPLTAPSQMSERQMLNLLIAWWSIWHAKFAIISDASCCSTPSKDNDHLLD